MKHVQRKVTIPFTREVISAAFVTLEVSRKRRNTQKHVGVVGVKGYSC